MSPTAAYGSGSTKRHRRTRAEIDAIREAIYDTLAEDHPATVRGLFYRLVSAGIIAKAESEYKGVVVRLATEMRLAGELPFEWIADHTRWRHGGSAFATLGDWLEESKRSYRLDLWRDQNAYVEVWLEKDALSGVLLEETDPLNVGLMVTRGYPSVSYLASAAANIRAVGKPAFLYYLGDYDPSGLDIPRVVERRLREFAPEASITFTRIAVTPVQIKALNLPTRPTKRTNSRAGGFKGRSVEVDAIPARVLRALVAASIEHHLDRRKLEAIKREEEAGRAALDAIKLDGWRQSKGGAR